MKVLSEKIMATEELEDFSVMSIDADSNEVWKDKGGLLHREDGPALVKTNGNKYWYQHGYLHREDGPAVEYSDNHKAWYLNGRYIKDIPA